jgi:perosamine synthetase
VFAVHYFGFSQRIQEFRAICDRYGVALIEDCAHVLRSNEGDNTLGSYGDASVFSWRKFLPVYDGGELHLARKAAPLKINYRRETAVFTAKVIKSLLDQSLEQSDSLFAKTLRQLLASGVDFLRFLRAAGPDRPLVSLDSNDSTFDDSLLNQPMSRVSRLLLRHADLAAIAARRRENFAILHEHILSLDGVLPLHKTLPSGVCPWVYPLIIDGLADTHLLLRKEGIPAVTWSGVRPAGIDPGVFPGACFLFENLVFLPVHQSLNPKALHLIAEKVQKVRQAATNRISRKECAHG